MPSEAYAEPQLTAEEAAHVRAVLRSTVEKLSLVSVLIVDASVQAREHSRNVDTEISRVIKDQKVLEQRFEALIAQRSALKAMPNKAKYKENQEELHEVSHLLQESNLLLCRNLKESPNIEDNMLKIFNERVGLYTTLSTGLRELEEEHGLPSLVKTLQEEIAREERMAETIESEQAASNAVKQLKQQLKDEKAAHDEWMAEKRKSLTALKEELKELKAKISVESKYKEKEASAHGACVARVQQQALDGLHEEVKRLQDEIALEKKVFEECRDFLKKKHTDMQEEVLTWMSRHEADTQAKEKDLENLKVTTQKDQIRLKELEDLYQQELAEKEIRVAEERRMKEMAVAEAERSERIGRAASKIQALFRGWKVRQGEGGKGKGKGKGKGGKGKKK